MPETARLTDEAQQSLKEIKEKHDVDITTSAAVETALEKYNIILGEQL